MYSYIPVLTRYIKNTGAKRVWEWGPGRSTGLILSLLDLDGRLFSVEHSPRWFEEATSKIKDDRWTPYLVPATNRASRYAVSILDHKEPFDVIFVDGRRRVECCMAALLRLSENGVVLLHDCHRTQYTDLLQGRVDVLEATDDTMVFRNLTSQYAH